MLSFCIQQKSQVAFLPFGCMRSDLNGLLSVSHTSTTEKKIACYWKKERIYSCRFHCCSCWYSSCSLFFSSLKKHFSLTLRHTQRYAKGMQCMTYETFFFFVQFGRSLFVFISRFSFLYGSVLCVCRFQITRHTHRIILRALIFGVPFWAKFFVGLCDNFAKSFLFRLISFSL